MADSGAGDITREEFQVIVRRAGLELTDDELARLLPMYERLMSQVSLLHQPELPLEGPAVTFPAQWSGSAALPT